jgi:hypothetical protein
MNIIAATNLIEFEFKYKSDGMWHKVAMPIQEQLNVLKLGVIENRPLAQVKLWTHVAEDGSEAYLIYDFEAIRCGAGNGWDVGYLVNTPLEGD